MQSVINVSSNSITMTERIIKEAYLDPSVGFNSAENLYRYLHPKHKNIKLKDIKQWLSGVDSHTMSKTSIRKNRKGHNRIPVMHIDELWDADLMDVQSHAKENKGIRYILIVIDAFSRFLWTRPLQSKKSDDIISAFDDIWDKTDPPRRLRTDGGSEFTNKRVQAYFGQHNVFHYVTQSQHKAYFAERVIKTLRSIMSRYLIQKNTHEYLSVLDKFTANYNATYHSSIKMSPDMVNASNQDQVWANEVLYPFIKSNEIKGEAPRRKSRKSNYKVGVGDHVRISYKKRTFERIYDSKFSGEVFTVDRRYRRAGRPVYRLKDLMGEELIGTFYNSEIIKITAKDNPMYTIEKILKSKTVRGKKMVFVKWLYYPRKFNSWLEASAVTKP